MTVARSQWVDLDLTPYYHCISRCVRRAFLCGEGNEHRKDWIENRLEELATIFAVSVCGYSVLDNHLHVVIRLEGPNRVDPWSDQGRALAPQMALELERQVWLLPFADRPAEGETTPGRPGIFQSGGRNLERATENTPRCV